MLMACSVPSALVSPGLTFLVSLTAHCSHPQAEGATQGGLDVSRANMWASANTSLLQGFWCQPASQLARDQLAALIRRMETQHVLLGAWQGSGGPCQDCLGVEGKGRLPGEGPRGRAGREASLAEDPGSKGQECGARTRSSSPEHKGPVLESCTIVSS
uniref:Mesothelin-like protein n=1 Tax=Tursiops truncatus TaxID=9739 RepID=A0A6J3PZA7_TURTR|nr:mesothelin-like protein [Tursiops truncatus]